MPTQRLAADVEELKQLNARIDERLRQAVHRLNNQDQTIDLLATEVTSLLFRVVKLEARDDREIRKDVASLKVEAEKQERDLARLKLETGESEGYWESVISFGGKLILGLGIAYLCWLIGIKSP